MNNLKRIKDLEKLGRNHIIAALVCYGLSIAIAIVSFIANSNEARACCWFCWALGFIFSTQSYQNYNDRRVAILNMTIEKMIDVLPDKEDCEEETPEEESEADTKESVIVSPEDFERFSRGEMTKEELLGIKKAVDKVTTYKRRNK